MNSSLVVIPARPDGRCHAVAAVVHGCDELVPDGMWTCDRHAIGAWKRGQELIADREVEAAHAGTATGRPGGEPGS